MKTLDDFVEEISKDFQEKVINDIYKAEDFPYLLNDLFKKLMIALEKKCPANPEGRKICSEEKEFHAYSMEALEYVLECSDKFFKDNKNAPRSKTGIAMMRAAALYILISIESIQDTDPMPANEIASSVMKELKEGFKRLGIK